jgi:hypothetical protein
MHDSFLFILLCVLNQLLIGNSEVNTAEKSTIGAASGVKVALLDCHFEGNVGDQMETIPLLRQLNGWGASVDCYLSQWRARDHRLNPSVRERVEKYLDNIYVEGIVDRQVLIDREYDIAIVAPGALNITLTSTLTLILILTLTLTLTLTLSLTLTLTLT